MARLEYTACAQDALRRADAVLSGALQKDAAILPFHQKGITDCSFMLF